MCCQDCKDMNNIDKALHLIKEAKKIYESLSEEEKTIFNTQLEKL